MPTPTTASGPQSVSFFLHGARRALRGAARNPRFHVGVCGLLVCLLLLRRLLTNGFDALECITAASCAVDAWDAVLAVLEALPA